MPAVEDYLVALRDSDAAALLLRPGAEPCWRIDGELLFNGDPLPQGMAFDTLLAELPEHKRATDLDAALGGEEARFAFESAGARFRAEILPSEDGPTIVLTRLPVSAPDQDRLHLPDDLVRHAVERPGLVFVCGPAGSGRTSTIAALLDTINRSRATFIVSVERSVEFILDPKCSVVHQLQVGTDVDSHAAGLEMARHAGADVIAVGDLPNAEAAALALDAADRGTLVIASMRACDPVECIERFLDLLPGDETFSRAVLAQNLRMVVYQILLPARDGGQAPAHEILRANHPLLTHLRAGRMHELHAALQGSGRANGQRRLDDSLEELVTRRIVARDEALSRARNRGALEQKTAALAT